MSAFEELYGNYKKAILSSGNPEATEDYVARTMAQVLVMIRLPCLLPFRARGCRIPLPPCSTELFPVQGTLTLVVQSSLQPQHGGWR